MMLLRVVSCGVASRRRRVWRRRLPRLITEKRMDLTCVASPWLSNKPGPTRIGRVSAEHLSWIDSKCQDVVVTSKDPDWVIRCTGVESFCPTQYQRQLIDEIERMILRFGRRPEDPTAVVKSVTPLVMHLVESGMSPDEISAHTRLRPQGVALIVEENQQCEDE